MNSIDCKITTRSLVEFIKKSFVSSGFARAVVAVSGGVDSATSLGLVARALGPNNVYPLLLPYETLNTQGVIDAGVACQAFAVPQSNITAIDIQPFIDPIIALDPTIDHVRKGNIMARMRMTLLFDAAKKHNALVIGTENKTEHLLGYYTRFGDEASDIEPLRNLYKTQVYQVARCLGVPDSILTKAPSAGLWEGQTDEGEFGFTYKEADEILSLVFDEKKKAEEVIAAGYKKDLVDCVLGFVQKNNFKHHLPLVP